MEKDVSLLNSVKKPQAADMLERMIYLKLQGSIKNDQDNKALLEIADSEKNIMRFGKILRRLMLNPICFWCNGMFFLEDS